LGRGKQARIDPELDEFLEKFQEIGDFSTKRKASKRAGEILNAGLDEMADGVRKEMEVSLESNNMDENNEDFGIKHDMLGL